MSKINIDKLNEINQLLQQIEKVKVYDMECKSLPQLYYQLAKKINELICGLNNMESVSLDLFTKIMNEIQINSENMAETVQKVIDEMHDSGMLEAVINHSLMETQITPEYFGAIGDGVTDDTNAIQKALDSNIKKIVLDGDKQYLVTKPLILTRDDVIIEGNNSTILWRGTDALDQDNGNYRYYGIITVKGVGESDTYEIKHINKDTTEESVITGCAITVQGHNYAVGDMILVSLSMGAWDTTYKDYKPQLERMCRVLKVDGDVIYTDMVTPFNFDLSDATIKRVRRANMVENCVIRNLKLKDLTADNFNYGSVYERTPWVGGISLRYCKNTILENIEMHHHKFPMVMTRYCYIANLRNLRAYDKSSSGGGLGYIAQIMNSVYINSENLYGENVSPVIDFTSSAFCSIRNAGARAGLQNEVSNTKHKYTCHGVCEHDILFDNCQGHIHFGNGIGEFPVLTENIKVKNCNGFIGAEHVDNLLVEGCNLKMGTYENWSNRIYGTNIMFDNCDIEIGSYRYTIGMVDRGHYNNKYVKFNNCNINNIGRRDLSSSSFIIRGFQNVIIRGCTIAKTITNMVSGRDYELFKFMDNYLVSIENNVITNQGLIFTYESTGIFDTRVNPSNRVNICNNEFKQTINVDTYGVLNAIMLEEAFCIEDNKWYVSIKDNIFDSYKLSTQLRTIYARDCAKPTGSTIHFIGNYCNNTNDWIADRLDNATLVEADNTYIDCTGGLQNYNN